MPASRVPKKPGGNNRQERKDAVSGREDGNRGAGDKLADSKAKQKGDHPQLGEDHSAQLNKIKASAAIAWQISTLPTAYVEVTRIKWHGQHAIVVTIEKVHPRGKNGRGRDCLAEQLVKTWWQWCHTST